jgi:MFS family permease
VSKVDASLSRLYHATHLFGMACGISIAVTSVHLDDRGFAKTDIGSLATLFASGVVVFSPIAGQLIRKVSAKWTFFGAVLGYAICLFIFPFMGTYSSVAGVRFIDGMCSGGVWVGSETILLMRASKQEKAHLMSLYAIWLSSGYVLGPGLAWLLGKAGISTTTLFLIAGVFAVASGLYTALRLPADGPAEEAPSAEKEGAVEQAPSSGYWDIFWRIKNTCFGSYAYGYFQSSTVLFLPLYLAAAKGVPKASTFILPGCFCFGMLLCANVAARVADRLGHLFMMRILAALGLFCVLGFVFLDAFWVMCVVTFLCGATLASMSPIALALQGVVTPPRDYNRANSIYNTFYGAGMLLGPLISSRIFDRFGGPAMLYHLVALWVAFILFTIVFRNDDPAARKKKDEPPPAAGTTQAPEMRQAA